MQVSAQVILFGVLTIASPAADPPAPLEDQRRVELQVGELAPEFACLEDNGQTWKSTEHVGKNIVVVYFYPADFTSGCSKQAEQFRDNINRLKKMNVEVVGISGDSVANHQLFKKHFKLNFRLLADEKGEVAGRFGVPVRQCGRRVLARGPDRKPIKDAHGAQVFLKRKVTVSRWTFIIGKDKDIIYKNTKVRPRKDSEQVIGFIRSLQNQ